MAALGLVQDQVRDALNDRLRAMGMFNHVIGRARIAGRSYWLNGARSGDRNLDDLASPVFVWGLPVRAADPGNFVFAACAANPSTRAGRTEDAIPASRAAPGMFEPTLRILNLMTAR